MRLVRIRHLYHGRAFFDYIWAHLELPVESRLISFYSYESCPEQVFVIDEYLLLVELVGFSAFFVAVSVSAILRGEMIRAVASDEVRPQLRNLLKH